MGWNLIISYSESMTYHFLPGSDIYHKKTLYQKLSDEMLKGGYF